MSVVKKGTVIVLLGALVLLAAEPACAQKDKLQHFGLGYVSASMGMGLSPDGDAASRRTYGILTALAVGAAKEIGDIRFSEADLVADLLGGVAAVSLSSSTGTSSPRALSFTTVRVEKATVFSAVYTIRF